MKKTLLSFFFAVIAATSWAQDGQEVNGLNYKFNDADKTATVVRWRVEGDGGYRYNNYEGDIVIPAEVNGYTVVAIDDYAFARETLKDSERCISSISIPATVKTIGEWAFYRCELLKSITIPASVERIGSKAFSGSGIETFTIEDGDKALTVGSSGFTVGSALSCMDNCRTMYVGRDINPEGTTLYTDYWPTFSGCENITDLTYGPKVTRIMASECSRSKSIKRVKFLGDLVTEIPEYAFESSEVTSIELPGKLQTIGKDAFYKAKIESVSLPGTLTTIASRAFYDNPLTSIVIPASVTNINYFAFAWCPLKEIHSLSVTPPVCVEDPFYQVDKNACKLYVPAGSVDAYKVADYWKEFFNIEAGINGVQTGAATVLESYTLGGQRTTQSHRGLTIQRTSNGIRKVIVR